MPAGDGAEGRFLLGRARQREDYLHGSGIAVHFESYSTFRCCT